MIFTLYRYIGRELLRAFILASIALTLILSLGSILQPVQEYGAGPRQAVFFMICFLPITLTFVLPMAALLAGSLVYGRFAGDNELDACKASGISVASLVMPGLALAIIVAAANLLLSFQVMPVFVQLTEKLLKADAKQMLFRGIQRKGFFVSPSDESYQIYADRGDEKNDILYGIIVTEQKDGRIKTVTTVQKAQVKFVSNENSNKVQIIAKDAKRMDALGALSLGTFSASPEFGSLLEDDVKFKKVREMQEIKDNLMFFNPVAEVAENIFAQLMLELLVADIESRFSGKTAPGSALPEIPDAELYYELSGEISSAAFNATQCVIKDGKIELSGEVKVVEYNKITAEVIRTLQSSRATITLETTGQALYQNGSGPAPTLEIDMQKVNVEEAEAVQLKMRHVIHGLVLPVSIEQKMREFKTRGGSLDTTKLTSDFSDLPEASSILKSLRNELARKIRKTRVQIKSEMHSRFVFGLGCVPMILIGIGLGIIKKGGHLLSAFGVGCVPAAVLIVCIVGGKQLTENIGAQSVSGVALMWSGLALLCLLALIIIGHLQKN